MNRTPVRWLPLVAALLVFTFTATVTEAQVVTTASMSGVVTDVHGAPLPGANVVAVHQPTGTQYGTATRSDGRFTLPNMRIGGPYIITASFVGYQTETVSHSQLELGRDLEINFSLREEVIEVAGIDVVAQAGGVINAERTGAAMHLGRTEIERLPTLNRSLSDFTRLSAQNTGFNSFAGRNRLYNNISVDGSVFNNAFGLASEVGGQTRQQAVSLDAMEQIQVSIAPYDVRQGAFTGAAINVVTRAGTNEFVGSAYNYLRNQSLTGAMIDNQPVERDRFSERQTGFSIGGPIVRNRAFFFVNAELRARVDPGGTFRPAAHPGETGPDVARVTQAELDAIVEALRARFGYDPGTYGLFDLNNAGNNLTARFDVNLGANHRASLRLNYLDSFRDIPVSNSGSAGGRQNNANRVPFQGTNYSISNDVYSVIGQLNSTFGNHFANQFTVGFTALRDQRAAFSEPFPLVDILRDGTTMTSFGFEPFTANNKLDTDIFQLSNSFSAFFGAHTITIGTSNQFYAFTNGFTPFWHGYFRFASLDDFLGHVNAPDPRAPGVPQPIRYQMTYSAVPGVEVPMAQISAAQVGLFAQDEWRALPNLRLTFGLRMDMPVFTTDLMPNPTVAALTFAGGERIDVSRLPNPTPLWSPRFGFNFDVLGNRRYQIRGGTGIFTGKIPFVWISNQASNNGLLFGSFLLTGNGVNPLCLPPTSVAAGNCHQVVLTPNRADYVPANPALPPSVLINATAENFKFPQVWRTSIGFDVELPYGFIGTLEGLYTRDLNAVFHRDANFKEPLGTFAGADNRPRFHGSAAANRINPSVTNAIILDNTNQGYQYFVTGELQKAFDAGTLRGLSARLAYTHGVSKDLTSSPSAIALHAWNSNQIVASPNSPELSFSAFDRRHRVIGIASYRLSAFGLSNTTLSLVYVGASGRPFSYTYAGDMNGDGISGNDLLFVPRDASQIVLIPARGDTRTAAEQWAQLDAFIAQNPYLSQRRGMYAERNGARLPWVHQVDFGIQQEILAPGVGGRGVRAQLSFDIRNFGNLLNSAWGLERATTTVQPLISRGVTTDGVPTFTFPVDGPTESFRIDPSLDSRWQALFGIRLSY